MPEPHAPAVGPPSPLARDLPGVLHPPPATLDLPGVGGVARARPEDFVVHELPAYAADGAPDGHLLFTLRKRGLTTSQALSALARHLDLPARALGVAGLKDRQAVTEQWVSCPAGARARLASFAHDAIQLGTPLPHSHKLRRGHLRGNTFDIRLRDLACPPHEALARAQAKLAALRARGGLDNLYGVQRFGAGGRNADQGLATLRGARRARHGDLVLSAGQSVLFNHVLLSRRTRGLLRTVLLGDVLQKVATGGLFASRDPAADQTRLDGGELVVTGPIFGRKTMAPPPGTPAAELEAATLDWARIPSAALAALGRRGRGARRRLLVAPDHASAEVVEDAHGVALRLRFTLPAGSYATALLAEVQRPVPADAR